MGTSSGGAFKYGTDASQIVEVNIPAVVIGSGSIDQAHTKNERLDLNQLNRCVDLYRNLMAEPGTEANADK